MKFSAIAFDLDGTLYPDLKLFVRLIPFVLKENRLLRAMGKARKQLRAGGNPEEDFYKVQADIMAKILKKPANDIREKTEKLIYRGWEIHFRKIRLFPHIKETLDLFNKNGLKLGLLSDFPPDIKIEYLGLKDYWKALVCSEFCGKLKPDPLSFLELAKALETRPEEILYVGNNYSYDVIGAQRAGMKTALIQNAWKRKRKKSAPDFIFHDYRQLQKYVLG